MPPRAWLQSRLFDDAIRTRVELVRAHRDQLLAADDGMGPRSKAERETSRHYETLCRCLEMRWRSRDEFIYRRLPWKMLPAGGVLGAIRLWLEGRGPSWCTGCTLLQRSVEVLGIVVVSAAFAYWQLAAEWKQREADLEAALKFADSLPPHARGG